MSRVYLLCPAVLFAGCSCNEGDFPEFPSLKAVPSAEEPEDYGQYLSLGTAPDNRQITMAYYDRVLGGVGFAVGEPDEAGEVAWSFERVDGYPGSDGLDPGDRGTHTTHRVMADGTVWVAYRDNRAGGLYARQRVSGPTWGEVEQVEPQGGNWASMAVDFEGRPVVAHVSGDGAAVLISRRVDGAWLTEEVWRSSPVTVPATDTASEDVTREAKVSFTRLDLTDGVERVVWRDDAAQVLWLAEAKSGGWELTLVDDQGDVGTWPSLLVGDTSLRIAYYDASLSALKLATRTDLPAFQIEVLETSPLRGTDTEIFALGDAPAIVYFDGYTGDQRLAYREGETWTSQILAGEETAAGFHNAVTRTSEGWWAGSYDYTTRKVRVVRIPDGLGG